MSCEDSVAHTAMHEFTHAIFHQHFDGKFDGYKDDTLLEHDVVDVEYDELVHHILIMLEFGTTFNVLEGTFSWLWTVSSECAKRGQSTVLQSHPDIFKTWQRERHQLTLPQRDSLGRMTTGMLIAPDLPEMAPFIAPLTRRNADGRAAVVAHMPHDQYLDAFGILGQSGVEPPQRVRGFDGMYRPYDDLARKGLDAGAPAGARKVASLIDERRSMGPQSRNDFTDDQVIGCLFQLSDQVILPHIHYLADESHPVQIRCRAAQSLCHFSTIEAAEAVFRYANTPKKLADIEHDVRSIPIETVAECTS